MTKPELIAYISNWHQTRSPAFNIILKSLHEHVSIEFQNLSDYDPDTQEKPVIFCQTLPEFMGSIVPRYPVTWIPMADNFMKYDRSFWDTLNRSIKILALSSLIGDLAKRASLQTFEAKFYLNPDNFPDASWSHGYRMMYWNRTAMIPEHLLYHLCENLRIDELFFRDANDPILSEVTYYQPDPSKLNAKLTLMDGISGQADYLRYLEQVNMYIAPRPLEGVGLTFLEALASGCVVIAADSPTMNEYIVHGVNGILLPFKSDSLQKRRQRFLFANSIKSLPIIGKYFLYLLRRMPRHGFIDTDLLNTYDFTRFSLQEIGQNARENHYQGYRNWLHNARDVVSFLIQN